MIFEYDALDRNGNSLSDIIDAPNAEKAKQILRSRRIYVVRIGEQSAIAFSSSKKKSENISSLHNLISAVSDYFTLKKSKQQVSVFSRQLATLLNAGIPLLKAISDIIEQVDNKNFRNVIADIKTKIESGISFSNALTSHNRIFSEMYINMVRVGENLGSLEQVIGRLAEIEEKNSILKNKIKSAMIYPIMITIFFSFFILFLFIFVIPTITGVFEEMGKELPLITKIVIGISSILRKFWFVLAALITVLAVYFRKYMHSSEGRKKIDQFKTKAPLIHVIYNKIIILNFTQNLGILLSNNVDLIKSLEIVSKIVSNEIIEEKIRTVISAIKEGTPVSKSLQNAGFLPKMVTGMIAAGESSDELDTMLIKIGNIYQTELDTQVDNLTRIIEPLIIIILGIIIGSVVIAIALPLMDMNSLAY
ncbi:MAG: type II secretion system F family protein [Spirochaetes bacterium]|nr:type II secretion system F family protein [Spirochaetota bacterium]